MLEGRDGLPIVNRGDLVLEECAMLLIITAEHILAEITYHILEHFN